MPTINSIPENKKHIIKRGKDNHMIKKCSKCVDLFHSQKKRLYDIEKSKYKSESVRHAILKDEIYNMLKILSKEFFSEEFETSFETEFTVKKLGRVRVDVLAKIGEARVAVECGETNQQKFQALKEHFVDDRVSY